MPIIDGTWTPIPDPTRLHVGEQRQQIRLGSRMQVEILDIPRVRRRFVRWVLTGLPEPIMVRIIEAPGLPSGMIVTMDARELRFMELVQKPTPLHAVA